MHLLTLPLAVFAAPGEMSGFNKKHANRVEMIAKKLALTEDEKAKVKAVFKEQHKKHKALKKETAEQMKTFDEMKKKRKEMKKLNAEKSLGRYKL